MKYGTISKSGRPPKSDQEKRTIRQTVNFTPDEYEKAKKKADRLNMSLAEFMRLSTKRVNVQEPDRDYSKMVSELAKIGSNLNQITKVINQSKEIPKKQQKGLNQIYKQFKAIKESIEK